MRRQKHLFFFLIFLSCMSVNLSANGQQQHKYDWDKVDEKALNERQPPDKVMKILDVKPGMNVGEVGAGGGRYAVIMAERVGSSGKVYANDIAQNAIDFMIKRCKRNKINNLEVILGTETDPKLPTGKLDLVYMTFTYRHLSKPLLVLKKIKPSLNNNGILAIIESKPSGNSSSEMDMINIAEQAGYSLLRTETSLTMDNIWIFKPKDTKQENN
jgi:ubiquinone/menaquinone biosynthesis C-methylase UbiE